MRDRKEIEAGLSWDKERGLNLSAADIKMCFGRLLRDVALATEVLLDIRYLLIEMLKSKERGI